MSQEPERQEPDHRDSDHREPDRSDRLDPLDTLRQVAGLAEHLRRIGVEWVPAPNSEAVETLAAKFHFAGEAPPSKSADRHAGAAPQRPAGQAPAATAVPPESTVPPASQPVAAAPSFTLDGDSGDATQSYPGESLSMAERSDRLARAAEQVAGCTRCEILSKCRTKTVFGEGNVNPRVVFIGEGPGRDEDLSGRPFVGKAGQLLTKMIQACKFKREDVYIMNTVKCRPPNNRNPEPTEIENCREYFETQLNLLRPEYIVCLGLVGAQALLRTKLSVGRMRGKFHKHFDSKVVVTYHPSYLLRTPAAKKAAWDDLQMMLRDAGLME